MSLSAKIVALNYNSHVHSQLLLVFYIAQIIVGSVCRATLPRTRPIVAAVSLADRHLFAVFRFNLGSRPCLISRRVHNAARRLYIYIYFCRLI